jgi:hypothetical protein
MSLKAKIEAVIYASEEPVTLAQLVGLLGQEAQQELDRLAARQQRLHLAGSEDVLVSGDGGESVPQRFEPKVEPGSDPTAPMGRMVLRIPLLRKARTLLLMVQPRSAWRVSAIASCASFCARLSPN